MQWSDVLNHTIAASLNTIAISRERDYCRRVPFTDWNGPSCVTVDELGMIRLERCDVPYCGTIVVIAILFLDFTCTCNVVNLGYGTMTTKVI